MGINPGQDTLSLQGSLRHTPTHSHSLRRGQFRRANSSKVHIFGMWKKPEDLDKTHEDMGRTRKLHTDSGPCGNRFFFLISIIMKWFWMKWHYLRNRRILGIWKKMVEKTRYPNQLAIGTLGPPWLGGNVRTDRQSLSIHHKTSPNQFSKIYSMFIWCPLR